MARRDRGFRWYRKLPVTILLILALVSLAYRFVPGSVLRQVAYPVSYTSLIEESAERHGVDPYLVCAIIKCESNWDETVVSNAGAIGLMQVMPETAENMATWGLVDSQQYSCDNLQDPATNIEYGCAILSYLDRQFGSQDAVIAAYNAGIGAVSSWIDEGDDGVSLVIRYPETAIYLERVNHALVRYRELYPDGISS